MDRAELQTFADRYVATWNRRNPAALAQYHAADGVAESPMYQTRRGRAAIEEAYRAFFTSFPDATISVEALVIDAPRLALFTTISATHVNEFFGLPGTNRRIEFRNARLFEFDDGLIKRDLRIYDFTGILVKVGVLRALPAKP
jgi:C-1 hydroxylase